MLTILVVGIHVGKDLNTVRSVATNIIKLESDMPADSTMSTPVYEFVDTGKKDGEKVEVNTPLLKQRPKKSNYPINK